MAIRVRYLSMSGYGSNHWIQARAKLRSSSRFVRRKSYSFSVGIFIFKIHKFIFVLSDKSIANSISDKIYIYGSLRLMVSIFSKYLHVMHIFLAMIYQLYIQLRIFPFQAGSDLTKGGLLFGQKQPSSQVLNRVIIGLI